MNYTIELDKYELATLKDLVKIEYMKLSTATKNYNGFERDILEDSKLKLLLLMGKLDNIIPVANEITEVKQ